VDGRIINSFLATKGKLDLMIKLEVPASHAVEIVSKTSPDYIKDNR
jgi:hypothetical protein